MTNEVSQNIESFTPLARSINVIDDIYKGALTIEDQHLLSEKRKFYEENDALVCNNLQVIRGEVEHINDWKAAKEKAREELRQIRPDILEKLFERFSPYIKSLPTGHSRGHVLRDTIYLTSAIFQNPEISNYDAVEVFVGMMGAMYHDIGNSVVGRYDEPHRFSGHAEVGAHLFGEIAKDIIGDSLLKMTQIAIAAHTHYARDRIVEKNGETKVIKPYDDEVIDGNKISMWWTRQSDRHDAQGPIMDVRHILTKSEPTEDFDGKNFHKVWDTPRQDFEHQFGPIFRSTQERNTKEGPEKTPDVLEHVIMFARSNYNSGLPYARHDSKHYRNFINAATEEQHEFVMETLAQTPDLPDQERTESFERFFKLCRLVEPAANTEDAVNRLRQGFLGLSQKDQSNWANGFRHLTGVLYPRMHERIAKVLQEPTKQIQDNDPQLAVKMQTIIDNHLHPLAIQIWSEFSPTRLATV